jgi:hypothetical protein
MSPEPVIVCASRISLIRDSRWATWLRPRVRFEDLADQGQPLGDLAPASGLSQFERDERGDGVTDGGGFDVRAVAGDHPALLHPVEPGLHGTPRDRESP